MKKTLILYACLLGVLLIVFFGGRVLFREDNADQAQQNKSVASLDFNRSTTAPTHRITACGTTTTQIVATSSGRTYLAIVNDSANTIYLGLGVAAVGSKGIRLNANGGTLELNADYMFTGAIDCIASSTSIAVSVEK